MKPIQEQLKFYNDNIVQQGKNAEWNGAFSCTIHEGKFSSGFHIDDTHGRKQTDKNREDLLLVAYSCLLEMMEETGVKPRYVLGKDTVMRMIYAHQKAVH